MTDDIPSILSHEEEAIAAALAAGRDPVSIAEERDASLAAQDRRDVVGHADR